jgi:hypothetical protein
MSVVSEPKPQPPARATLALAAVGPIAIGGILAARAGDLTPMALTPAIVFGVAAATCPALYIGIAATKEPVTLAGMMRGLRNALGAFGLVIAGLVLPVLFLSVSSTSDATTLVVTSAALAGAGILAMIRLGIELAPRSLMGGAVCVGWMLATLGIAGRFWIDTALEVMS